MAKIRLLRVKLHNSNKETLIKTKTSERDFEIDILLLEGNEFYTISGTKEEFERKKYAKTTFDLILKALSKQNDNSQFHYDLSSSTFVLTKVELFEGGETYKKILLRVPNMKQIELSEEAMKIVLRQMEDVSIASENYNQQQEMIDSLRNDFKKLNEQYSKLADEKEKLEKEVAEKCLKLINEKKKFVDEKLNEACKNPYDTSFDVNDYLLNEDIRHDDKDKSPVPAPASVSSDKDSEKEFLSHIKSSPIPSTSKAVITPKSSKKSTPMKKIRTPSKRLFQQTQEQDSDDFDILPLREEKTTTPTRKRKSANSETISSSLSCFKITPKKSKLNREEKESSVELKIDKSESHFSYHSPSSNNNSDIPIENAQQVEATEEEKKTLKSSSEAFNTAANSDEFSQAMDIDLSPTTTGEKQKKKVSVVRKSKRNVKNPYSADTLSFDL